MTILDPDMVKACLKAGGGGYLTISCPLSAGRCYFPSTVVGWIMY